MTPGKTAQGPGSSVERTRRRLHGYRLSLNARRSTLDERGFTFVEIMIVLVIIGILVTMAQPSFSTSVQRAREAALSENLFIVRDVIDQYYADHGAYPPTLEALVERRYLRKIPKDPITGSDTTWVLVLDVNVDGLEEGIFDIKSGSDLIAMDGTPYKEW